MKWASTGTEPTIVIFFNSSSAFLAGSLAGSLAGYLAGSGYFILGASVFADVYFLTFFVGLSSVSGSFTGTFCLLVLIISSALTYAALVALLEDLLVFDYYIDLYIVNLLQYSQLNIILISEFIQIC